MPPAVSHKPGNVPAEARVVVPEHPSSEAPGLGPLPLYSEIHPSDHAPLTLAAYGSDAPSWAHFHEDIGKTAQEWRQKAREWHRRARQFVQDWRDAQRLKQIRENEAQLHFDAVHATKALQIAREKARAAQRVAQDSGGAREQELANQALAEQKAAEVAAYESLALAGKSSFSNGNFRRALADYKEAIGLLDRESQADDWAAMQWKFGNTYRAIGKGFAERGEFDEAENYRELSEESFKKGQSVYAPNDRGEWSPRNKKEWLKFQRELKPHWSA